MASFSSNDEDSSFLKSNDEKNNDQDANVVKGSKVSKGFVVSDRETSVQISVASLKSGEECEVKEFTVTGNCLTPIKALTGSEKEPFSERVLNKDEFGVEDDQEDCSDDEYDEEEEEEDNDEGNVHGVCLHCSLPPPPVNGASSPSLTARGIQVSCDECHSFICSDCHWCHEYQANHEIRVCDRCDAFYCKECDEMDQCEDCGEVACAGCGSLCSCKFCGCGLCEDCATACGRCGIVLCARDAKFAVECDTCKMPYCLVCLASGTKEPCVRCGHKTSKRVEQLVHLRLKSIYKAFKQSGAALSNNSKINDNATTHGQNGNANICKKSKKGWKSSGLPPEPPKRRSMHPWLPKKSDSGGGSMPMPIHASVAKYAEKHGKDGNKRTTANIAGNCNRPSCSFQNEDISTTLHVAATVAVSSSKSRISSDNTYDSQYHDHLPFNERKGANNQRMRNVDGYNSTCCSKSNRSPLVIGDDEFQTSKICRRKKVSVSDRFASRTQAEADAAAAALLAELDKEKLCNEANSIAKKKKKKKKKERQQAEREKEKEVIREEEKEEEKASKSSTSVISNFNENSLSPRDTCEKIFQSCNVDAFKAPIEVTNPKKKNKEKKRIQSTGIVSTPTAECSKDTKLMQKQQRVVEVTPCNANDDSEEEDISRLAGEMELKSSTNLITMNTVSTPGVDDVEKELSKLVSMNDLEGIERLLSILKGVPGRAALRKNAKKAVKRINEEKRTLKEAASTHREKTVNDNPIVSDYHKARTQNEFVASSDFASRLSGNTASRTGPLLELVSHVHGIQGSNMSSVPRSECVMSMSPSVVGWVIGKGGQRIRDLMEESGAKIWIDQDSMGPKEMRIVYVSGSRKSVDVAVRMVKELVAKAPVKTPTIVQTVNDSNTVASTRSSLTSTPVSFVLNTSHHGSGLIEKQDASPNRAKVSHDTSHIVKSSSIEVISTITSSSNSPSHAKIVNRHLTSPPKPPPGMERMERISTLDGNEQCTGSSSIDKSSSYHETNAAKIVKEIPCEHRFVPLLIGKRGWTVKSIQDESGARVDIDQTVNPRRIIISGEMNQVDKALRLVQEVLSYPHAQLHHGSNVASPVGGNESSIRNTETLSHATIEEMQHISANGGYSTASHQNNDPGHFMGRDLINRPHISNSIKPTMTYCRQKMTIPSPDMKINRPISDDLDKNIQSDLTSTMKQQHEEQYQKNILNDRGHNSLKPSHFSPHMLNLAQQPNSHSPFCGQIPLPPSHPPSGSHFVVNHGIQNLRGHTEKQQPLQQQHPIPGYNLHLETILPLSGSYPSNSDSGFNATAPPSSDYGNVSTATYSNHVSVDCQSTPSFSQQQEQDKEIIADLFGPCGDILSHVIDDVEGNEECSSLRGFNKMSLGSGAYNVNWSLSDTIDDRHSTQRSVGLGGVRLDWSDLSTTTSSNQQGESPFGAQ